MSVEEIARLDEIISDNLDLIPVANWGFGQDVLEDLKRAKHFQTNQQLSRAEKKSLNKHQKQKIARGLGSIHYLVSEVIGQMKNPQFADTMPRNPKRKFNGEQEVKQRTDSAGAITLDVENEAISDGKVRDSKRRKKESESQQPATKTEKQEKPIRERKPEKAKSVQKNCSVEKNTKKAGSKKVEQDVKPIECMEMNALDIANDANVCETVNPVSIDSNMNLPMLTGLTKKPKNDFRGRDYGRLLVKAEKRNEKLDSIRERNPEKAKTIESNIQWDRAMKKAAGEKVKDNVELLKKGLKRKLKQKQKSKMDWSMREKNVDDRKAKKQNRRDLNIKKRKDDKIKFQQKRRLKKGT